MRDKRYPKDWDAISLAARNRADNKCQLCGAPNGQQVIRMLDDDGNMTDTWRLWIGVYPQDGNRWTKKPTKIVLTVHHIGLSHADGTPGSRHDKMDNRIENLITLCQKCHFAADRDIHVAVQKRHRREKWEAKVKSLGQLELF